MKFNICSRSLLMLYYVVVSAADKGYESKLAKLWSTSDLIGDGVRTEDSDLIRSNPTDFSGDVRISRNSKIASEFKNYVFKPRAIPLIREQEQLERNTYYSEDNDNGKYKNDVLFPGNYVAIAEKKSNPAFNEDKTSDPLLIGDVFKPTEIPLIRNEEFQIETLSDDEEPIIEKPSGFTEPMVERRSISYIFGEDEADDDDDDDSDGVTEAQGGQTLEDRESKGPKQKPKAKRKQLSKYMMPLLLAYKLKYVALIPLMISGLVLLVGATGMAGFFFALFAAVMGLQKGGY